MKCKKCNNEMKEVEVKVEDAKNKVMSYQCDCGHFEFEDTSSQKVVSELKEQGE